MKSLIACKYAPIYTVNGTPGVSSFACFAHSVYSATYDAWYEFLSNYQLGQVFE